jgi:hypothetical protein
MKYEEFLEKRKIDGISMGISNSTALQLINFLPVRYKAAHHFWSWVWMLSLPGAFVIGYYFSWWWTPVILFFISPAILHSVKKSCAEFVLEYAEQDPAFFTKLFESNILSFHDKDGKKLSQ